MSKLFLIALAIVLSASAQGAIGVRLLLGLTDTASTKWDGSVAARGARIRSLEQWRFEAQDKISGNEWTLSTHAIRVFGGSRPAAPQIVANGVIVWLDGESDSTELQVKTPQGSFTVRLGDIPFGKASFALNRRAMADRIPAAAQITSSTEEQDFPAAAADKDGNIWLAYLEFRHSADHNKLRAALKSEPKDFSHLTTPTGGDQIFVKKYSGGQWSEPIAITEPGGDVYRPAIAVDGQGRPWVFWPSNQKGNFDIWARVIEGGKPGASVQLSTEAGSDIDPAAATDSTGKVWVAWQGWRGGRASIFSAVQNGSAFSKAATVSSSTGNEWNPAIAADSSGRVTVAWDSYRNGNYDIYARTAAGSSWAAETPLAATARYEAYPSIAYDPAGTLWMAYEEGGERWGKDYGAYETSGVALYQGRAVRMRGFARDGRQLETNTDAGTALPGPPDRRAESDARQGSSTAWTIPSLDYSKNRPEARPANPVPGPRNTMPRLRCDPSGRLWLAVRSQHPIWWSTIGTNWSEHLASFDGSTWTGPIFVAHSDNLLDNRPAMISTKGGELMVIGSSDSRRNFQPGGMPGNLAPADPYNNDLYTNTLSL
ncbi:MAG: hypothetical protein ABIZ80_24400, partial [Bryobacteraceae bacterium]